MKNSKFQVIFQLIFTLIVKFQFFQAGQGFVQTVNKSINLKLVFKVSIICTSFLFTIIVSSENNMIESFKLSKRSLNKLFENSSMDINRILAYIDSSNLSYKDESDVIKMLEFAFSK